MIKYVPEYIFQKYEENEFEGCFKGYALFFDIKDFTRITEALTRKGQKGAEVINKILENAFSPVINTLEKQGGFVTGFAGDAFMSVFENVNGENILTVFQAIKKSLEDADTIDAISEGYKIDARLVVAYGEIRWMILNNDLQNEYFFFGDAIQQCNEMADIKKDIQFSETAITAIGREHFIEIDDSMIPKPDIMANAEAIIQEYHFSQQTRDSFLNKIFAGLKVENEIRDISNAFIHLNEIEFSELRDAMLIIEELANRYQAFFNKLDYSDKGLLGILIFGAPRRREKTLERMMYFAIDLIKSIKQVKLGISSGRVYAGYTGTPDCQEYTILGYPPNLASRLMMKAKLGETLVDIFSQELLLHKFNFSPLGEISMKGFAQKLPVYEFVGEKQCLEFIEKTAFTNREVEIKAIIDKLFYLSDSKQLPLIYIHGDPGIGKSRLLEEAKKSVSLSQVTWCYLLCDGILRKPYAPVIRFLKEYFGHDQNLTIEENENKYLKQWQEIAGNDLELIRIESIIGQLLGYRWRESIWELLPPEARAKQERNALALFFRTLARNNQTVIHIEDGQWIDDDTLMLLKEICHAEIYNDLGNVICSRYVEDGSKVDYKLNNVSALEIEVGPLADIHALDIIKFELGLDKIPKKTANFILNKSQGNPLYLEQITLYLKEQEYLDKKGNLQKDIELVTAFGISDIIGARIDNLTDDIRQLVYYASVLGIEFDIEVLSKMLEHDLTHEAEEVVDNCIWNKLRELHYIFSQILFRDTAYSRLLEEKRKSLNLLAAESYEKIYKKEELKPYFEMIAMHYERAGLMERAFSNYTRAFFVEYRNTRLNKALELAQKSLEIASNQDEKSDYRLANCYYCLGLVYYEKGDYNQSLKYNLQALAKFEEQEAKISIIISILNNVGNAYSKLGEFQKALDFHGKSLLVRVREFGETHPDYAMSMMHLGNIYRHTGKNDEAQEHFEKALEILLISSEKVPGKLVTCYNNMGAFYLSMENFQKALEYLGRALPILKKMNALDKPRGAALFRQIGFAYNGLGKHDKALDFLNKAMQTEERIFGNRHPATATTYDYLGRVYFMTNDLQNAEEYLFKALSIYKEYYGELHEATADIYQSLSECSCRKDDCETACKYLQKSYDIMINIKPKGKNTLEAETKLRELKGKLGK